MIYEVRTYDLIVGGVPDTLKAFATCIEKRQSLSPLLGLWYTEVGPLNQIIHIWKYDNANHRAEVRAEAIKHDWWPPKIRPYLLRQHVEICIPWDFSPIPEPGDHGPYYEMRSYMVRPGYMSQSKERWRHAIHERMERSPMSVVMETDIGDASKIIHIWPYKSLDERQAVRDKVLADGLWPPTPNPGDELEVQTQENKIMLPAQFSPMR